MAEGTSVSGDAILCLKCSFYDSEIFRRNIFDDYCLPGIITFAAVAKRGLHIT